MIPTMSLVSEFARHDKATSAPLTLTHSTASVDQLARNRRWRRVAIKVRWTTMQLKPKTVSLLILAATALACSATVLHSFRDPEGPNPLIIVGLAAIIYLLSLAFYLPRIVPTLAGPSRVLAAIIVQLVVAVGVYLAGR